MDFFQHVCYLHARVPRVRCYHCGVLQVHVPWARPGSGFTLLFEAVVMSMEPHMPVAAIARHVREHDTRLRRILDHHAERVRERADFRDVTAIAIDQTPRRRGHRYVSVVAGVKKRRVLFATKGEGLDVIGRFAADFHTHGGEPSAIKHVGMDMSPAFVAGVRGSLPAAEITFDRRHIMKLSSDALDDVRKAEAQENPYLGENKYLARPSTPTAGRHFVLAILWLLFMNLCARDAAASVVPGQEYTQQTIMQPHISGDRQ